MAFSLAHHQLAFFSGRTRKTGLCRTPHNKIPTSLAAADHQFGIRTLTSGPIAMKGTALPTTVATKTRTAAMVCDKAPARGEYNKQRKRGFRRINNRWGSSGGHQRLAVTHKHFDLALVYVLSGIFSISYQDKEASGNTALSQCTGGWPSRSNGQSAR